MKRTLKKFVCAMFIAVLSIGAMACGSSSDDDQTTTAANADDVTTTVASAENEDNVTTPEAEETTPTEMYVTVRYRNPIDQLDEIDNNTVETAASDYYALEYWEVCQFDYEESDEAYYSTRYDKYLIFASETQAQTFADAENGVVNGNVVDITNASTSSYYVDESDPISYAEYLRTIGDEDDFLIVYDEIVEPETMAKEIAEECTETLTLVFENDSFSVYSYDNITGAILALDMWMPYDSEDEAESFIASELASWGNTYGDNYFVEFTSYGMVHEHFENDNYEWLYGFETGAMSRNNSIALFSIYGANVYDGEYLPFLDE